MHVIEQCSNCGCNVKRRFGVVTSATVQHRECAARFGRGTYGRRPRWSRTAR
jgi:hypothetical protein